MGDAMLRIRQNAGALTAFVLFVALLAITEHNIVSASLNLDLSARTPFEEGQPDG